MSMTESDARFRSLMPCPRTNHGQAITTGLAGFMGYSKKRIGRDGKPRYTACYLDARGALRSAGTFSSRKDSDKAWQKTEARLARGA